MVTKRKLMKILPILSMALVSLFLIIIGFLVYFYYHSVFGNTLSIWFAIIGLSLIIIAGSHILIKMTRNPNIMRQYETTPSAKRDVYLLVAAVLFNTIVAGLMAFYLFCYLISSGYIVKPIYFLMSVTAIAVYAVADIYVIWESKKLH
jgi:hypothetical protein